jgi:DNA-binding SARP family transcriptional activator
MLLWPTHDSTGARKNLRVAFSYLNQALGAGQEMMSLDLHTLVQTQRLARSFTSQQMAGLQAQLEQAAALYRGAFLEGLDPADVPEFESWVAGQGLDWLAVATEVLERLAARHLWAACQAALVQLNVAPGGALTTLAARIDLPLGTGPTPSRHRTPGTALAVCPR